MPRSRKRIADGIYRVNGTTLSAKVQVGSGKDALYAEQAFDADESLKTIQKWREEKRLELRRLAPAVSRGSIAAEVDRYIERAQKRPASVKSKLSEMRAWLPFIGHLRRHQVKPAHIDKAIASWLTPDDHGKATSKKTVLNRCRTLHHFYVTMADDKKVKTPLDNIDIPKPEQRAPAFVSVAVIRRVEKKLRPYPLEHAYYLVMTSTGLRPAQIDRLRPTITKADIKRGVVLVAGGKGGRPIPLALNPDQRAAFSALLAMTGTRDASRYARRVRQAGWPAGVRPYNARHAVGIELAERGESDESIQKQLGHVDVSMVRRYYTGVRLTTMKRISGVLAQRALGWADVPRAVPRKGDGTRRQVAVSGGKAQNAKSA